VYLDPPASGTWVQGVNFFKISTNTGTNTTTPTAFTVASPNGLSTPLTVDSNADGLVDFVYAGDLVGNLWKFDLTSASPTSWGVSGGAPLFTAVDASGNRQPITTAPVTSPNSAGGIMVLFGTGKYLEQGDDTGPYSPTNSFYGIWDQLNGTTVARSQLMVQQVLNVGASNPTGALTVTLGGTTNSVILTSAFVPNYTTSSRTNVAGTFGDPNANPNAVDLTATTPPQLGWVLDFPNSADGGPPNNLTPGTGEKVAFDPLVSTGKVVVTTLIPSNIPCLAGGTSFIMDMDPTSGSRLTQSPFDLNGDKAFSTGDYVTYGGVQVAVTGLGSTIGIVPQPTVIQAGTGKEIKVLSGSSGGLMSVLENALGSNTTAGNRNGQRVSWREMLSD
jgi:type IV pilus assembly protein PilY1